MQYTLNSNVNWIRRAKSGNFSICQIHSGLVAVDAVHSTYNAVLATLQIIIEWDDRAKAIEAEGISLQVKSFKNF